MEDEGREGELGEYICRTLVTQIGQFDKLGSEVNSQHVSGPSDLLSTRSVRNKCRH